MFSKTILSVSFGLIIAFGAPISSSAALLIDDFSTGPIVVSRVDANLAVANQAGLDPNKVLGGTRDITVGEFSTFIQTMTIDTNLEQMIFETDANTLGYFDLDYGSDSSPLNIDLRADGSDAFIVDYISDQGSVVIRITSENEQSGLNIKGFGITNFPLANGMTRAILPFDSFLNFTDFSDIQKIGLTAGRFPRSSSLIIGQFATVRIPEPSTCLMACGFGAILLCNKRSTKAS